MRICRSCPHISLLICLSLDSYVLLYLLLLLFVLLPACRFAIVFSLPLSVSVWLDVFPFVYSLIGTFSNLWVHPDIPQLPPATCTSLTHTLYRFVINVYIVFTDTAYHFSIFFNSAHVGAEEMLTQICVLVIQMCYTVAVLWSTGYVFFFFVAGPKWNVPEPHLSLERPHRRDQGELLLPLLFVCHYFLTPSLTSAS